MDELEMIPGGSPATTLWDELIHCDNIFAAAGFIRDLFGHFVVVDRLRDGSEEIEGRVDTVRSQCKEDLLYILDDNDGSQFREWLKLFKEDLPAFQERAFHWACTCCEMTE